MTEQTGSKTQRFYDRIADAHNVALKLNGYRGSLVRYLKSVDPDLGPESMVLDAGSGTGIVTLGLHSAGFKPKRTVTFDLSYNSLALGLGQFKKDPKTRRAPISAVQGNILRMPFADASFDLVLSCGVLEYVPLSEGLDELARVLKPGGKLIFIPVKPSIVGAVLELLYKFKTHPLSKVREESIKNFRIVGNHKFKIIEPMGWSKAIFLLEKK